METGFSKGQSDNLPKVTTSMMFDFFHTNKNFISSEMRGVKTSRSCRNDYGDNAIGYVQVKRDAGKCIVKAKITPEHKVKLKPYQVVFICDEKEEEVEKCVCEDCPASQGGCKHAVAFLSWLHRRSEEPSRTSIRCYWKKSKMAGIGTSIKTVKAQELGKPLSCDDSNFSKHFLANFLNIAKSKNINNTPLTSHFLKCDEVLTLSIHRLIKSYVYNSGKTADEFIEFCKTFFNDFLISKIRRSTTDQSNCSLWRELRYGRITASRLYEAANCNTLDGSLVEYILGAKTPETAAMKHGQMMEHIVFDHLKLNFPNIQKCGLFLRQDHPIFGASPDGVDENYIFEIKCPLTAKWEEKYIINGQPVQKFAAQMQLQMLFAKRSKGIYVVASPEYKTTKQLVLCVVNYDSDFCSNLMKNAEEFWKKSVFKILN